MAQQVLLMFLAAFAGTFGFGILVRAPWRSWIVASLLGGAAFALYWLLVQWGISDPLALFLCSMAGSVLGLICAVRMKMIGTTFLMMSIISFVPGLGLYRTMRFLGAGLTSAGADQGIGAMITIAMIALGQGTGSLFFRAVHTGLHSRKKSRAKTLG